jgi:hypothetical protein
MKLRHHDPRTAAVSDRDVVSIAAVHFLWRIGGGICRRGIRISMSSSYGTRSAPAAFGG